MNWNYETKLTEYILQAQRETQVLTGDYNFVVCNEQTFIKMDTLSPTTIYVIIKYLSSNNTRNAVIQPIQIMVNCEQNHMQGAQIIFNKLVEEHNFDVIIETSGTDSTYIKQDYREPVVLSNFNEVSYGFRSIIYISATLYIMENIIDISEINIKTSTSAEDEGETVKPIGSGISYSMTPNTQPIPPTLLATSVKSVSTLSLTLSVPLTTKYNFIEKVCQIMSGELTGNQDFYLTFSLGEIDFEEVPMKLTSAQITTSINDIPSLQIGLIR